MINEAARPWIRIRIFPDMVPNGSRQRWIGGPRSALRFASLKFVELSTILARNAFVGAATFVSHYFRLVLHARKAIIDDRASGENRRLVKPIEPQ